MMIIIFLTIFLILLAFSLSTSGVVCLAMYLSKPRPKLKSSKPVKLTKLKKLIYHNLTNYEYNVLSRIKYNLPKCHNLTPEHISTLKNVGFNLELPMFKINLSKNDCLADLSKTLSVLRKLEEYGYPTNIAINYLYDKITLQQIKLEVANHNFIKSVIKIHFAKDLSLNLLCAVNLTNINYPTDTKIDHFDAKNIGYCVDIQGERYNFFDEVFQDNLYVSKITTRKTVVLSKRTFDFSNNFDIQRFDFINLTKTHQPLDFVFNVSLSTYASSACYKTFLNTPYSLIIIDKITNTQTTYVASLPIFKNITYTKQGIVAKIAITKQPYLYIAKCYSNKINLSSLTLCEHYFTQAKLQYNSLNFVKVFSPNPIINKLINHTLPSRIVSSLIYNSQKLYQDFQAIINNASNCHQNMQLLSPNYLKPSSLFITNKNCVKDYFALLYIYFGVYFTKSGIIISPNKTHVLDNSQLTINVNNSSYKLKITNSNKPTSSIVLNGVEYSNFNFINYNQLDQNLVLQI